MKVFSQEELQTIWTYYSQVGEDPKERSHFIQDTFASLFNEEGALPLEDALKRLQKEIHQEFALKVSDIAFDESDEEEVLYLRYLQRDLLKPKGDHLLTLKKVIGMIVVVFLVYLALRGKFF